MGRWWGETENLRLDDRGRLWRVVAFEPLGQGTAEAAQVERGELEPDPVFVRAGSIDQPDLPAALDAELAELLDGWRNAFDAAEESRASYLRGLPSASDLDRYRGGGG